ncbi:MAG: TIGR00270 family protein [Candidatus Lokiarchaeota archaeon]|nr:TIGR00270 family protein [Candidatus Lokiarchaeota archaeon]
MPSCELCGREIKGRGRRTKIDGVPMLVCSQCASQFGQSKPASTTSKSSRSKRSTSWVKSGSSASPSQKRLKKKKKKPQRNTRRRGVLLDDMMVVKDYAEKIRTSRQKKGLSQEQLAQRVGERISTLQSIEAGRLKPTMKTIRGIERELGISLLEPIRSASAAPRSSKGNKRLTLGDVVKVKRKKSQKRENSED